MWSLPATRNGVWAIRFAGAAYTFVSSPTPEMARVLPRRRRRLNMNDPDAATALLPVNATEPEIWLVTSSLLVALPLQHGAPLKHDAVQLLRHLPGEKQCNSKRRRFGKR